MENRRNHVVDGTLGPIRTLLPFTKEEMEERTAQGIGTPLDLVPISYWRSSVVGLPRFSEEMLGKDF